MSTAAADEVPESPAKKAKTTSEETEGDGDDDDFYGDDLHEMTDQEWDIYEEAIRRSGGFDVPRIPDVSAIGIIQPAPHNWPAEDILKHAEFAIEDQNEKRNKEGGNELRLKGVTKCNLQPACPLNFFLTLEAEDIVTGELDEYEAMVITHCGRKDMVHIFRKKAKPTNPPASTEHGPSDSDCAVEEPSKVCES